MCYLLVLIQHASSCTLYKVYLDQNIKANKKKRFSLTRIIESQIYKNVEIIWFGFKIPESQIIRTRRQVDPWTGACWFNISLEPLRSLTSREV